MKIGKMLRAPNRKAWRSWLAKNHRAKKEIWLVYARKHTGKARVPYDDAVEEALCFGWIDGTVKRIDENYFAQRFSPRRSPKSQLSETNKERVRRMIAAGLMTPAGMEKIAARMAEVFIWPKDVLAELKKNRIAWKNFRRFPESYQRVRLGWLNNSRHRADVFQRRLAHFLKMTEQNRKFGTIQ